MDFLEALREALEVIKKDNGDGGEIIEIYIYEPKSQTQLFLQDCEEQLIFEKDKSLPKQVYLDGFDSRFGRGKCLSLDDIFNEWEVCIKRARRQVISKRKEASDV